MKINNLHFSEHAYNIMKWILYLFLPALTAVYIGLAGIWNFDHVKEATLIYGMASVFIATMLELSVPPNTLNVSAAPDTKTLFGNKMLFLLPNNVYDTLVYVVKIVLPALATLTLSLPALGFATLFGVSVVSIASTISIFAAFGGALLGISNSLYSYLINQLNA